MLHAVLRFLVDICCAECGVQGRSDERCQPRGGGGEAASRLQQGLPRCVRLWIVALGASEVSIKPHLRP